MNAPLKTTFVLPKAPFGSPFTRQEDPILAFNPYNPYAPHREEELPPGQSESEEGPIQAGPPGEPSAHAVEVFPPALDDSNGARFQQLGVAIRQRLQTGHGGPAHKSLSFYLPRAAPRDFFTGRREHLITFNDFRPGEAETTMDEFPTAREEFPGPREPHRPAAGTSPEPGTAIESPDATDLDA